MQIQCQYFLLQVTMKLELFYSFEHPEIDGFCHMGVTLDFQGEKRNI